MSISGRQFPTPPSFEPPPPFQPPPSLPPPPPGPPYRLRLWHLFLWTFASALIAALMRRPGYMRELTVADERAYLVLNGVYCLIAGPFVGASLWFIFVAIPRRMFLGKWLHSSLGSQPGHWLLLIGGMETLGGFASVPLSLVRVSTSNGANNTYEIVMLWVPAYLAGLLLAFFAWNRCTKDKTLAIHWSVLFWTGAVARMLCCLSNPWSAPLALLSARVASLGGMSVVPWPGFLFMAIFGLVLLGNAAVADARSGKRQDAFHWLGVAATAAILIYPLFWTLLLPLDI
jgi:hypothetical protein